MALVAVSGGHELAEPRDLILIGAALAGVRSHPSQPCLEFTTADDSHPVQVGRPVAKVHGG